MLFGCSGCAKIKVTKNKGYKKEGSVVHAVKPPLVEAKNLVVLHVVRLVGAKSGCSARSAVSVSDLYADVCGSRRLASGLDCNMLSQQQ